MELHKNSISGIEEFVPNLNEGPFAYFERANRFARRFYAEDINRISSVKFLEVSPEFFFREYIWVVHATGFSAKAVGSFFPRLMRAYGSYKNLAGKSFDKCWHKVQPVCNNRPKASAVHQTSKLLNSNINNMGWKTYRDFNLDSPNVLKDLPFIGPVTCYHLGRNIGLLDCVKPDLHLVRMAERWHYEDCNEMCEDIQKWAKEDIPLGIVDLILWYSASTFGTIDIKTEDGR